MPRSIGGQQDVASWMLSDLGQDWPIQALGGAAMATVHCGGRVKIVVRGPRRVPCEVILGLGVWLCALGLVL